MITKEEMQKVGEKLNKEYPELYMIIIPKAILTSEQFHKLLVAVGKYVNSKLKKIMVI